MVKRVDFVLDCSMAVSWCFADEATDYSDKVLLAASEMCAWVPALWCVEMSNVLLFAERKKRIDHMQALAFRKHINNLLIEVDNYLLDNPIEAIFGLARSTQLTAYDATYLELCIRKKLPIATLDKDLQKTAKKHNVDLYLL